MAPPEGLEALEAQLRRRGDLVVSSGLAGGRVPCLRVAGAAASGGVMERVTVEPGSSGQEFVLARGERLAVADVPGAVERLAVVLGGHVNFSARADARTVGAARAWCRRVLTGCCESLHDVIMVVSELLGNAVRHTGETPVASVVTLWHEGGGLHGEIRHPVAEKAACPATPVEVLAELATLGAAVEVPVEALAESGRGLLVVRGYTAELHQAITPTELVTTWRHGSCGCVWARST